ncbi:hypothetical protein DICVIV_02465 [Dictyocaulus viviparus]|uniref:Uncharacterized protein n=1 Tax=Dictyocaulus viviparus TaxID=29172 RepID=A0A0D8Y9V4_DICVI|nr:hypothetical protein DICVIV_02465 [Dictyocaulus viviparus]
MAYGSHAQKRLDQSTHDLLWIVGVEEKWRGVDGVHAIITRIFILSYRLRRLYVVIRNYDRNVFENKKFKLQNIAISRIGNTLKGETTTTIFSLSIIFSGRLLICIIVAQSGTHGGPWLDRTDASEWIRSFDFVSPITTTI